MAKRAVCTIITKSYLAYARTLAKSLAKHNPELPLYVLFADQNEGYLNLPNEPFRSIELNSLHDQVAIQRMAFYYSGFEFCCALRPILHDYLLSQTDLEEWVFLDADILVSHSLRPVFEELAETSILLCPHMSVAVDSKFADPLETGVARHGVFNGGFLGLRRTKSTRQFVDWFQDRLVRFAFSDNGYFVDQIWLNLVPFLFSETAVCRHPGANLGHWNLHERALTRNPVGEIFANSTPLLWVHFSGWNIEEPEEVSQHGPMYRGNHLPLWAELGNQYREALLANGLEKTRGWPYTFNRFNDGVYIRQEMRRHYYELVRTNSAPDANPFELSSYFRTCCPPPKSKGWRALVPSRLRKWIRKVRDHTSRSTAQQFVENSGA